MFSLSRWIHIFLSRFYFSATFFPPMTKIEPPLFSRVAKSIFSTHFWQSEGICTWLLYGFLLEPLLFDWRICVIYILLMNNACFHSRYSAFLVCVLHGNKIKNRVDRVLCLFPYAFYPSRMSVLFYLLKTQPMSVYLKFNSEIQRNNKSLKKSRTMLQDGPRHQIGFPVRSFCAASTLLASKILFLTMT